MTTPPRKRGRPALATPSDRIKLTVDVTPETYAALTALRAESGLSMGRLIDGQFSTVKKIVKKK